MSRLYVRGSNRARASVAVRPGIAAKMVPIRNPDTTYIKDMGSNSSEKLLKTRSMKSMCHPIMLGSRMRKMYSKIISPIVVIIMLPTALMSGFFRLEKMEIMQKI